MSYYVSWASTHIDELIDRSYPPPEAQWLHRADELCDKLKELEAEGAPYRSGERYTDTDLLFIDADSFFAVADAERALQLTLTELSDTYGIDPLEPSNATPAVIIPLTPTPHPPKAA